MLIWNEPVVIDAALNFAIGGVVAGCVLLAGEYFAPRWSVRLSLIATALLAIVAVAGLAWGWHWEIAVPCAVISSLCALSSFVRTQAFARCVLVVARPAVVMGALLLVSLVAARFVQSAADPPPEPIDNPLMTNARSHAIEGLVALTDQGHALPLIAYDDDRSLPEVEQAYLAAEKFQHQVIRLAGPSPDCNCHGWIYTGGRFAIGSSYIDDLLKDNRYVEVSQPRAGDLVIYRGTTGTVEHTGLVRLVDDAGLTLVESKWGPLGVYLHPVDAQPYGISHHFYRSARAGHLVTIAPESSVSQDDPVILAAMFDRASLDLEAPLTASRGRPATNRPIYDRPVLRVPGQRKT